MGKQSFGGTFSERGMVKALRIPSWQATFSVAREDRDGCSRYRAAKMPAFAGELGWYRESPRP